MSTQFSKWDVLSALAKLKKTDAKAYHELLVNLNVERWSQIKENDYGPVLATCQAKVGAEVSDDDDDDVVVAAMSDGDAVAEMSDAAKVDAMGHVRNSKLRSNAKADDLRTIINAAPSLAEGLQRASVALFAREADRAAKAAK